MAGNLVIGKKAVQNLRLGIVGFGFLGTWLSRSCETVSTFYAKYFLLFAVFLPNFSLPPPESARFFTRKNRNMLIINKLRVKRNMLHLFLGNLYCMQECLTIGVDGGLKRHWIIMALDIKRVICVRIQPSNKGDADFSACSPVGLISLHHFCALKAGDNKMA